MENIRQVKWFKAYWSVLEVLGIHQQPLGHSTTPALTYVWSEALTISPGNFNLCLARARTRLSLLGQRHYELDHQANRLCDTQATQKLLNGI